ncbi:MAG TPA: hypothetical protein VJA17_04645, partial [Candidatus Omnitrophota bacterium]|nr:hypothetical protein [Candidatus Omnitrophota bacterium]
PAVSLIETKVGGDNSTTFSGKILLYMVGALISLLGIKEIRTPHHVFWINIVVRGGCSSVG